MSDWLTIRQAAELLQVHPRTVRRAIARGDLRASQIGRECTWRLRRADLDAWLEHCANVTDGNVSWPPRTATTVRYATGGNVVALAAGRAVGLLPTPGPSR